MHDPSVVAFDVRGPWLTTGFDRGGRLELRRSRWTGSGPKAGTPRLPWWRPAGWELFVLGRRRKLGIFAVIWHEEPGGADALTVCRTTRPTRDEKKLEVLNQAEITAAIARAEYDRAREKLSERAPKVRQTRQFAEAAEQAAQELRDNAYDLTDAWRWHVRHWRVQLPWLQKLSRRLFTRCAYCRGRSGKGRDVVNVSRGWDSSSKPDHFWQGEQGVFHGDCLSADDAWKACVCEIPAPDPNDRGMAWYHCLTCGLVRMKDQPDGARERVLTWRREAPRGVRPMRAFVERQNAEARARSKFTAGVAPFGG